MTKPLTTPAHHVPRGMPPQHDPPLKKTSRFREALMMDRLLLTPEEVARLLGVGRSKVYALLRDGEIESVRIGGSRRVPPSAVVAYVERLRGATAQPVG